MRNEIRGVPSDGGLLAGNYSQEDLEKYLELRPNVVELGSFTSDAAQTENQIKELGGFQWPYEKRGILGSRMVFFDSVLPDAWRHTVELGPSFDLATVSFRKVMTAGEVKEWLKNEQAKGRMIGWKLAPLDALVTLFDDPRADDTIQRGSITMEKYAGVSPVYYASVVALGSSTTRPANKNVKYNPIMAHPKSLSLLRQGIRYGEGTRFLLVRTE